MARQSEIHQFLHLPPSLHEVFVNVRPGIGTPCGYVAVRRMIVRKRPVNKIHVEVVQLQVSQRLTTRRDDILIRVLIIPKLGGDPYLQLAGHVVELDVSCSIDIDSEGWSTVAYTHQLLNLTNRPIKRLVRELWFETTNGPLVIEPSPNDDRKVTIQRTHDMNNLSNFACHISPGIPPGDVATISYFCRGGRFVRDHYWRQAVPRYTRRLTLSIRHRGVHMLLNCTAIEEHADGSEVSAIEDLACTDDDGAALITVTRDYLQPSQAVTLRWEVSRASS
jgi:hypothetical protein